MPHIDIKGCRFNVRIDGTGHAPWVTLAHGLATNSSMWDDLVAVLSPRYRVLRYDARGHGGTSATPGDYSWDLLVGDAVALLDQVGMEDTHFVGLSMGGMVGLGLALDHSARLLSLCACNSRAEATPEYKEGWSERVHVVRTGGMDALVERTLRRWFTPAFLASPSPRLEKMRAMMRNTSPEGYCGCAAALQTLDYGRRLQYLKVPTLYVVGADDLGAPPSVVRTMHASTPGSRYVEIAHAGHISAVEQPDEFNHAIVSFIDRVDARAG